MAKFTSDTVERVRQAADMVEIVGAYTDLRRAGTRYTGLCPFHDERTPSFSVNAEDKLYHCFGCGVGGDLFDFVAEKEGLDFPQAVEALAERYGVEVKRESEDPQAEARRRARQRLFELLERAASYYAKVLREAPEAAKVRAYLAERGLSEQSLADFGVGYAPSAWDTLLVRGQQAGFKVAELRAVGLTQRNQKGGEYDRFRSRIIFPIRDARGRVLGFGARATRDQQGAKYVNSAETDFFHKSEILYGIERARAPMAKAGRAVVAEGYTDVIALHQAGITEAVGVMGTAITEQQLALLSGTVGAVVLALDADSAGQSAMLRAQRVASGRNLTIMVAAMPPGEDPAEMLAEEGGPERFRQLIDGAVELPEFHLELILGKADPASPRSRDAALAEAAPILAQLEPGATMDELVRRVASRLKIDPPTVMRRVAAAPRQQDPPQRSAPRSQGGNAPPSFEPPAPLSSRERRERGLLAMCMADPAEGRQYLERLGPEHLSSPLTIRALEWLKGHLEAPTEGLDPADRELSGLIAELAVSPEREGVGEGSIHRNFIELELRGLEDRIAAARDAGDAEERARLNREAAALRERLRRAEAEAEAPPERAGAGN